MGRNSMPPMSKLVCVALVFALLSVGDAKLGETKPDGVYKAKILVYDQAQTDCSGAPGNIGGCSKMDKHYEQYLCEDGGVTIAKCLDSKCLKCSHSIPNPYGYMPSKCVSDFLRVVCTSEPWTAAPSKKSAAIASVESKAKARLKDLQKPVNSAEVSAKARIKLMNGGHDEL